MAVGFLVLISAALVAATLKRKTWWLRIHRTVGLCGASLMLMAAVTIIAAIASSPEGHHLRTPHTWLGAFTVIVALITPLLGFLQFRIRTRSAIIRTYHRICGRLLMVLTPASILFGLRAAEIL
jgi:hypothetical protein